MFPTNFLQGFLGFIGTRRSLVADSGLRKLLRRNLHFENLQDAPIPLHVVTTDVFSGADELITRAHDSTCTWLGHHHRRTGQAALLEPHHD